MLFFCVKVLKTLRQKRKKGQWGAFVRRALQMSNFFSIFFQMLLEKETNQQGYCKSVLLNDIIGGQDLHDCSFDSLTNNRYRILILNNKTVFISSPFQVTNMCWYKQNSKKQQQTNNLLRSADKNNCFYPCGERYYYCECRTWLEWQSNDILVYNCKCYENSLNETHAEILQYLNNILVF